MLIYEYGTKYTKSTAKKYVSDIAFAGTVVGQLLFGWLADHWSRTNSLLVSTVILIVFTALATGSYFKGEDVGMFNMLTAWRFFVSHAWHTQTRRRLTVRTGRNRHRRGVPGGVDGLRRVHWRAEEGYAEHVVHHVHEHDD